MRDNTKGGALTEVTFYILLSLYTPKHGYAVMQFIEEKTGGRLSLGAGTLYGALNSLQDKKWIEPYGDSEGRKKEYHITAQGKEIAEKELARLNELVRVASEIIGEVQYEEKMLSLLWWIAKCTGKLVKPNVSKRLSTCPDRKNAL